MNHFIFSLFVLVSTSLVGCAQVPLNYSTPSGQPEITIADTKVADVRGYIIGKAAANGSRIVAADDSRIVISRTMEGGQAVMTQLAIGNAYSTTPTQNVQMIMVQQDANVTVYVSGWTESQMAFGQVNRLEADSNAAKNELQAALIKLKTGYDSKRHGN
jgi:hypothetical protein